MATLLSLNTLHVAIDVPLVYIHSRHHSGNGRRVDDAWRKIYVRAGNRRVSVEAHSAHL
jgi:hypothetical protein